MQDSLPALIQKKLIENDLGYVVVNAGISGDTSGGGLTRIEGIINIQIDIFVLELGANDLLRGYLPAWTKNNLQLIIDRVKTAHSKVDILLLGMRLPDWIPGSRAAAFRNIYQQLANENKTALFPFLLEGVAGIRNLNMVDGLHPLAEGYQIIAKNIWPTLFKLIEKRNKVRF